jgi:hypothetical protein
MRAYIGNNALPRILVRINLFSASLGVDAGEDILQSKIDREQICTGVRRQCIVDCRLAGRNDGFGGFAIDRQFDDMPFEGEIIIPLIIRQMLVVPLGFAGLRIERNGGIQI